MSDLHNKSARGDAARHAIHVMQETFARLQAAYLQELVTNFKKNEEIEIPSAKLAVLDDIVNDLVDEVTTGRKAQERLAKQREQLNG